MANTIQNAYCLTVGSTAYELEAVGGTLSLTSAPSDSDPAVRFNPTTTATGYARLATFSATGAAAAMAGNPAYFTGYFRIDTLPASGSEEVLRAVSSTTTLKLGLRITSAGKLALYDASNTLISTGATTISTGTYYKIGVKTANGTTAAYELVINDASELSGTANLAATNVTRFIIGKFVNSSSQTIDVYWKFPVIDTAGYIPSGSYAVRALHPNSDISNQFTGGTGSSDYAEIDEAAWSTADYIKDPLSVSPPLVGDFTVQSFAAAGITDAATVYGVKAMWLASDDGAVNQANTFQGGIVSSGVSSLSNTVSTPIASGATDYGKVYNTDPNGSIAWTQAAVEALYMRFSEGTSAVGTRLYAAQLAIIYKPATASGHNNLLILAVG